MGMQHKDVRYGRKKSVINVRRRLYKIEDIHYTYGKSMAFVIMSSIFFRDDLNVQKSPFIVSTNSAKLSFHNLAPR